MELPVSATLKTLLVFRPESELGPYVAVRMIDSAVLRSDRNSRKRGPSEQAIRASIRQGTSLPANPCHSRHMPGSHFSFLSCRRRPFSPPI